MYMILFLKLIKFSKLNSTECTQEGDRALKGGAKRLPVATKTAAVFSTQKEV